MTFVKAIKMPLKHVLTPWAYNLYPLIYVKSLYSGSTALKKAYANIKRNLYSFYQVNIPSYEAVERPRTL